jgi:response regulator RpfG family c-di-GMP phosphodiesterase
MKISILVLDDEEAIRKDLSKYLTKEGYDVCIAGTIQEANEIIQLHKLDYSIIDLKIDYSSEYGGIKVIENLNKLQPRTKTIVLSANEKNPQIENQLNKVAYYGYVHKGGIVNYITAVIHELKSLQATPPKRKCFVIMPFSSTKRCTSEQWLDIFENMIKPSVESCGYDYECYRASLVIGNIIRDILDNLNKADIVIADMTDRNPNVFYELGVRHALRNATILITQDIDDIPFDLRHYATIKYEWTTKKGKEEFGSRIKDAFSVIENDPDGANVMSPIREYLKL